MTICNGDKYRKINHDEIVYDDNFCPLCKVMDELDEAQKEIETLRTKLDKDKDKK